MRGRQALLTAAVTTALLGMGVADAPAKTRAPRVFKATAVAEGAGSVATASARCPGKRTKAGFWRAVSGGFKMGTFTTSPGMQPPQAQSGDAVVYEFRREGARSWRASAQSLSGGVSLTVFVNCQLQVPKPRAISSALATPGRSRVGPTAVAQCPSGRAVSGGFSTPLPFTRSGRAANTVVGSFPNGRRQWRAQVISRRQSLVRSFVYCVKHRRKAKLLRVAPEPASVATTAGTLAFSPLGFTNNGRCPPGRFSPGGGGFRQFGMTPTDYFVPVGLSQRPKRASPPKRTYKGSAWQAAGVKVGSATPVTLQAVAICG